MTGTAQQLQALIESYLPLLREASQNDLDDKPSPSKWSKKELIGHLIDSAQNNIRRFIMAQYEESPVIIYNQDQWVAINHYQQWDTKQLINLWYSLNLQIVAILENISPAASQRICMSEASHTIEWLAQDYGKHLQHHMCQVLNLDPVAYP